MRHTQTLLFSKSDTRCTTCVSLHSRDILIIHSKISCSGKGSWKREGRRGRLIHSKIISFYKCWVYHVSQRVGGLQHLITIWNRYLFEQNYTLVCHTNMCMRNDDIVLILKPFHILHWLLNFSVCMYYFW